MGRESAEGNITLCIGVQGDGCVDIYTDSRVTGDVLMTADKVFPAHGAVWAMAGNESALAVFLGVQQKPYRGTRDGGEYEWMLELWSKFRTGLREIDKDSQACSFIGVVRNRLWVFSDAGIPSLPHRGYACVGSGAPCAYGAIELANTFGLEDAVMLGICRIVSSLDESVGPPFVHVRVTGKQVEIIEAVEQ